MEHAAPTDDAGDWEVVQKEDATSEASPRPTPELSAEAEAPPAATGAPSRNPQAKEAPPSSPQEVLMARLVYCLLCCLDVALKLATAATQMACRAGLAAAQLAQKLEAAARPVLAAVKAAAKQIVGLLRELDVRGAAALVVQHTAAAAAWVVAAVEPSVANVQRTASSWHAAAGPTLTTLSAAQLREKRRRALVAARTCVGGVRGWAHAKYATLDPAGRLPAAVKKVAKPPGVIYLLAGLGVASMLLSALLILAAG